MDSRWSQGGDLTVRDSRVFLKTLEGLKQVDVILRRVDGGFCDPIELRSDSFLGVAGLVEAVRAGNVVVANALGSGLIETPALMPFLPGLSSRFLGEKLKLPSVATWWCGQAPAMQYVRDHLDSLVIKPSFPVHGNEPVFGGKLRGEDRTRLLDKLQTRPWDYAGQELLHLSTAPVWSDDTVSPHGVWSCAFLWRRRETPGWSCPAVWPAFRHPSIRPSSRCSAAGAARIPGSFRMGRWIISRCSVRAICPST